MEFIMEDDKNHCYKICEGKDHQDTAVGADHKNIQ